jgi:hypothetical protein
MNTRSYSSNEWRLSHYIRIALFTTQVKMFIFKYSLEFGTQQFRHFRIYLDYKHAYCFYCTYFIISMIYAGLGLKIIIALSIPCF